jgi:hypothetical protein
MFGVLMTDLFAEQLNSRSAGNCRVGTRCAYSATLESDVMRLADPPG